MYKFRYSNTEWREKNEEGDKFDDNNTVLLIPHCAPGRREKQYDQGVT